MITRINKNVICVKDIPSNLIEEAIFILKSNDGKQNGFVIKAKNKEIVMAEINEIIKDCSEKLELDREKAKAREKLAKDKLKRIKLNTVTCVIVIMIICFAIFLFK